MSKNSWPEARQRLLWIAIFVVQLQIFTHYSNYSWFWTDESFSAVSTLMISGWEYLKGGAGEANVAPLFYFLEKLIFQLQLLIPNWRDPVNMLRLFTAILPMTIFSIAVIWRSSRLFEKFPGKFLAVLCVFFSLNGMQFYPMLSWQARPYALWICFTWFFLESVVDFLENSEGRYRIFLFSLLLAFTSTAALPQIVFAILAIALFAKSLSEKLRVVSWLLPSLIVAVFYATKVPNFGYDWPSFSGLMAVLLAHAKFWIILPILLFAGWNYRQKKSQIILYFWATLVLTTLAILVNLYLRRDLSPKFEIANRYFAYLLPCLMFLFLASLDLAKTKFFQYAKIACLLFAGGLGLYKFYSFQVQLSTPRAVLVSTEFDRALQESKRDHCVCLFSEGFPEMNSWGNYVFLARALNQSACQDYLAINVDGKGADPAAHLYASAKVFSHIDVRSICQP